MSSATFKGCNNIPLLDLMLFLWCCIYQSTAIFTSPSTNADIFFFFFWGKKYDRKLPS